MLRKAESAVLKTPSILLIPPLILLLILLLIPLLMLLLIPLLMLLLRERANPCALMIGAWPAALLGGGWPDPDPGWPEWWWPVAGWPHPGAGWRCSSVV